jgi:hypothetical protein
MRVRVLASLRTATSEDEQGYEMIFIQATKGMTLTHRLSLSTFKPKTSLFLTSFIVARFF